jgi:Arc/MetJ family transcription regulator
MCIFNNIYTHPEQPVRTNIEIDDALMKKAMKMSGAKTKREAVERGLEALIRQSAQHELLKLRGKLHWEGDLDEMRELR